MPYVTIDAERCKGCELCVENCNRGALGMSTGPNSRGYLPAQLVNRARCTACNLCAIVCPDVAIAVYK